MSLDSRQLLSPHVEPASVREARRIVAEITSRWTAGETPDALAALETHPDLRQHHSLVLDLIYEEICLRAEANEALNIGSFSARFGSYADSVHRMLAVHQFMRANPEIPCASAGKWPQAGLRYGPFQIIDEIGRGARGRVYVAKEIPLGNRLVAIKVSIDGIAEAEILGQLSHRNIVPVHSVLPAEDRTIVCMPYLGRVTLFDVMVRLQEHKGSRLRAASFAQVIGDLHSSDTLVVKEKLDERLMLGSYPDAVAYFALQVLEGLEYLHGQGFVHHDIKPSNILITSDGRPVLLDFNLSRSQQTIVRQLGGTLPYTAPERLVAIREGDASYDNDIRTDLFSFGVLLYEVVMGHLPFGANDPATPLMDAIASHLDRQGAALIDISELTRRAGKSIAVAIEGCLQLSPQERPSSAAHVRRALQQHFSFAKRFRLGIEKRRRAVQLAVLGILVIGAALGAVVAMRQPAEVRLYQQGLALVENGEYASAVASLDAVIQTSPMNQNARRARATALIEIARYQEALADLNELRLAGDEGVAAAQGYCMSQLGYHREAVQAYEAAIRNGDSNAAVLNNIAFSLIQLRKYDVAVGYLDGSIEKDSGFQPAYVNRALLELARMDVSQKVHRQRAIQDVEQAIALGPETVELYLCGAMLCDDSPEGADDHAKGVTFLIKAIELGADHNRIADEPRLANLRTDPAVARAQPSKQNPRGAHWATRLMPITPRTRG